ncbi:MAG TPA: SufD family Fe-S cluster assembly protein, partial [Thermomicrobiaceae bacterium]|nr:SufD family Fe-S cluster assembly protein [Thermomicrobiaceae bacterium]
MEASLKEATAGFSREAVEELSSRRGEPDWVRQRRIEAWEVYERTPMPTRNDEEWRRTDIRKLPIDTVVPYGQLDGRVQSISELDPAITGLLGSEDQRAALNVQIDSGVAFTGLNADLAEQGVIFTDLTTAIEQHPDLIQQYFMTDCVPATDNKFAALNGAFWAGGTFVYVPKGVKVEVPLRAEIYAGTPGAAVFPHTLIIAEEDSSVVVVEGWDSPTVEEPAIASGVVEIFAKEASQVRYIQLQNWGRSVWNFVTQRSMISQDAIVNTLDVALGSKLSKWLIASNLIGPGSLAEMLGLYFADESQHLDFQTRQLHASPYGTSDLLYKGAIKDRARTVFSGIIDVYPHAQRTDAYQANRNLVLSRTARADTMPKLEIGANDVRCTHGATVGQIE